jgi:hypothetical protein
MLNVNEIRAAVENESTRSAWTKGVKVYALELVDDLAESISGGYFDTDDLESPALLRRQLLNGASDWNQYSWGGCSLIYDTEIAARLCTPSELKKTHGGERNPNNREQWLDVQARALRMAANMVISAAASVARKGA